MKTLSKAAIVLAAAALAFALVVSAAGVPVALDAAVTPDNLTLNKLAEFDTGFSDAEGGVAEIVKYNADNGRFYLVNGKTQTVDIVTLREYGDNGNEAETVFDENTDRIDFTDLVAEHGDDFADGFVVGDITSVAVNTDLDVIAVAVQHEDYDARGAVVLLDYDGDYVAAYAAGAAIASYLKEYGFNLDFAPVADVLTNPDNTVIGDRSFGSDPALVSQMVAAAVRGFQENGVNACIKHFPGHGDTAGDSHDGQVETDRTLEEMQMAEFLPFTAGIEAGVDMVMVGHISAPGLTDGDKVPASMNEKIITGVLREQLGYNGVVITDAMNMSAITQYYAADEAAVKALKAGADMILMPEDFTTAYNGVIAAVQDGTIAEERVNDSLKRIFRVKYGAGT